ncbi:MAG TPA: PstS family phosphate ABC transporter substrate-binding protein [Candidatus Bathyarchaeia archaeon]|nr:PstS family phosphate ABC transporter substrate-binding protein [Candidatus Bathyarchaeia archaeon]
MAARLITGLAAMALCAGAAEAQMLQIKGSDTVINLVQRMAEIYMQKNPGKQIAVTGGGTGTGIAALINGKCDVANASRTMKQSEVASAMANGVDPVRIVIGMDGVSVIVNGSNTVDQLTMDQLGKIFRGEVTNWSEVGGKNMPITLYGRQPNSGTFGFFMEVVLKGDYSPKMNQMNGNAQIVEAVKSDPSGIGYVGVGYAKTATGIVVLKVARSSSGPFASPLNAAEVNSGAYPIARPLNQYVSGAPKGAVKDFIAFELGPEGQKLVEEEGFFPLPDEYATYNQKAGF